MAVATRKITSINPATEEELTSYDEFTPNQVDQILAEADAAFRKWRHTSFPERAAPMRKAAEVLRRNKARYAGLITAEMGKPIAEAEAEIEKCAWNCEFYAENAERFLADEHVETNARDSYVAYEPLGVVLAIMPWNFPFWQVIRFAAPALMAGNAAVLKHASNVPQCALAVEQVFAEAGFPKGLFRTILVGGGAVERIIENPHVKAVTLTGSSEVGEKVASAAGRALKKQVLELGGSDPFIVLKDADLDAAVETAVKARFQNTGQSCICAKRFIVEESVADEFERRLVEAAAQLKLGDPTDRDTKLGPLARPDLVDSLERQVNESVQQGAKVLLGGKRPAGKGAFYQPTVLSGVDRQMTAFREETFGPVAAIVRVKDEQQALELANDSEYGLGASIWSRDLERAQKMARQVESGAVFVNALVASDPRMPFGGVKRSGYGRELAAFGIREFTNIQTIWVGQPSAASAPPTAKSGGRD